MRMLIVRLLTIFIILPAAYQLHAATQALESTTSEIQPKEPHAIYVLAPQKYLGQTPSTIISKLGTPLKQSEEPIKNTHDPAVIDYIHTLSYGGLKLTTYEVRKWGKEYLLTVEMEKNYPQVSQGLEIGMTEDELKSKVGPTSKNGAIEWALTGEEGEYAVMTITLDKGKVAKILWTYPLD
jgi:hypothetical protein